MADVQRWAGIVRVSRVAGRTLDDESVHAPDREQVELIKAHANLHGVELQVLPPELDVSGGVPLEQRPSLMRAIEGVERGEFDGIIVAYLSRLGRNVREQLRAWDRVEAAGGRVVVVQEGLDTTTPAGRFMRTVMLAHAEHELDMHRQRFENLRRWATQAGIWQRRQTPLGYARDPATRGLVPDADAPRVRRAFDQRTRGMSIGQIARELGITQSGARQLLRNRVYLGELRVGAHVNPQAHPPIVSEDQWLAAQAGTSTRSPRSDRGLALLAGLARCASCGHVMSPGSSRRYRVYTCHRYHSAGSCPAPAAITRMTLEAHVERIAVPVLGLARTRTTRSDGRIDERRRELREAERELAAYLEGVSAAGLRPEQYAKGARLRRDEVDRRRDRLAQALAHVPEPVDGNPAKLWQRLDAGRRNRLLRSLLECVLVAPAGGRGRRVPIDDRVRLIVHGAGLAAPYRGGGAPRPIEPIPLPERDDPLVLGVELAKDALELARG